MRTRCGCVNYISFKWIIVWIRLCHDDSGVVRYSCGVVVSYFGVVWLFKWCSMSFKWIHTLKLVYCSASRLVISYVMLGSLYDDNVCGCEVQFGHVIAFV